MSSEDSSNKESGGKKSSSLSMTQSSSKRQKTNNKETQEVTVELDMSMDEVPLKTTELNHEFMAEIDNLQASLLCDEQFGTCCRPSRRSLLLS